MNCQNKFTSAHTFQAECLKNRRYAHIYVGFVFNERICSSQFCFMVVLFIIINSLKLPQSDYPTVLISPRTGYFCLSSGPPLHWRPSVLVRSSDIEAVQINFFNFSWKNPEKQYEGSYFGRSLQSCPLHSVDYINRASVPSHLKLEVLKSLHENHTGIVRMKMIARSYVYWSTCDKDMENYVN